MKLKRKLGDDSSESSSGGLASWADTNPSEFRKLAKQARTANSRPPEFWVKEDESRMIRFLDTDAIVSFKVYRVKTGKNSFERLVAPSPGKKNVFQDVLRLKPQRVFVFRIIDIDGYKGRKGRRTNLPRFYVVGARVYDQIRMLAKENADTAELNQCNIKISRSGAGTETTYAFFPKPPTPLTPEMKKAIKKFPDWREFYKPIKNSEQDELLARIGADKDQSEDED